MTAPILITGAGQRIGLAFARACLDRGQHPVDVCLAPWLTAPGFISLDNLLVQIAIPQDLHV